MNTKRTFLTLAFTLAIAIFAIPVRAQNRDEDRESRSLVGSWRTTVSPVADGPQFTPYPGLITFNADGTLIESDGSNAALSLSPPNPFCNCTLVAIDQGHGVWKRVSDRRYEIKFLQIAVDVNDSSLVLTNTLRFTVEVNGNGDRFQGPGTFRLVDANGNPIPGFAGPEKIKGRRIEIE